MLISNLFICIRPTNPSMNRFNNAVKYAIIITIHRRNVDEENLSYERAMAGNSFSVPRQRFINNAVL